MDRVQCHLVPLSLAGPAQCGPLLSLNLTSLLESVKPNVCFYVSVCVWCQSVSESLRPSETDMGRAERRVETVSAIQVYSNTVYSQISFSAFGVSMYTRYQLSCVL